MADIYSNDKLLDDDEQQNGQADQNAQPGTSGLITGGANSTGVSTAGVGAGGTGWTNIQSYLSANKGGTGSEKLLQDNVGKQFGDESTTIGTKANETKAAALDQVKGVNDASTNAKTWVNQSADAYDWAGNQSDAYTGNVNKLKSSLTGQYSGPNQFDYAMGEKTQNFGSNLGSTDTFRNMMSDFYRNAAGGQMTRGGADLQTQLDTSNEALAKTRENLLSQYAGLGDQVKNAATDVGKTIGQARTDYGKAQNALSDTLGSYGNEQSTSKSKAEIEAKRAHEAAMDAASGYKNYYVGGIGEDWFAPGRIGAAGNDATWREIQQYAAPGVGPGAWEMAQMSGYTPQLQDAINGMTEGNNQSKNALTGFYNQERSKYGATADAEKRRFNTIMDILSRSDREKQGFDVIG